MDFYKLQPGLNGAVFKAWLCRAAFPSPSDLEGPQPEGAEWADGGPGGEQRLREEHGSAADAEAL